MQVFLLYRRLRVCCRAAICNLEKELHLFSDTSNIFQGLLLFCSKVRAGYCISLTYRPNNAYVFRKSVYLFICVPCCVLTDCQKCEEKTICETFPLPSFTYTLGIIQSLQTVRTMNKNIIRLLLHHNVNLWRYQLFHILWSRPYAMNIEPGLLMGSLLMKSSFWLIIKRG